MANPTSNFNWQMPTPTDLVTDLPADFEVFGQAVDSSMADLLGGTTGQVLAKNSNANMDFVWVAQDDSNAIQNAIVDAKGDLIAASANDTPARLAVGANGETLVADSSTSTGLRYNPQNALANPVINGGMDVWQRGTSIAGASSVSNYTVDRWIGFRAGSTFSRQTVSDSTNLPNIQYSCRIQRNSGTTGTSSIILQSNFETVNSIPFAGKTVTVSYYARVGANFSGTNFVASLFSGTGTDQVVLNGLTGQATVVTGSVTPTTTWQRFVLTGTVASTATQLAVDFYFIPSGTAGANDWVEVTGVQIDLGTYTASTAPTFRRAGGTLQGELSAAQRYYYRNTPGVVYGIQGDAIATSTTAGWASLRPPVRMRIAPSAVEWGNLAYQSYANNIVAPSAITVNSTTNTDMIRLDLTMTAVIAGHAGNLINNNNAAGYLGFSAEL